MSDPVVSVVVYISEPLTRSFSRTLASAAEQSFDAPEIIVVAKRDLFDDAVSAEILRQGSSIRHYVCDSNTLTGDLLRIGTDAARGRFITWLKADDVFDPRKIQSQMDAMGSNESGCVTCGSRTLGQPFSVPVDGVTQDTSFVIRSLLAGTRDAATLLASRDCLDATGGFNPSLELLPELDLAVRLAVRYPILHVPAELVRRGPARVSGVVWSAEFCHLVNRIIQDHDQTGLVDRIEDLAGIVGALSDDIKPLIPSIQKRLTAIVKEANLCVGIFPPLNGKIANPETAVEMLGVPNARVLVLPQRGNQLQAIAALLGDNRADWILLIDPAAPPQADPFALQLLHCAAEKLDACLPHRDPLVYLAETQGSLIPGALFRRSTLEKLPLAAMHSEEQFWASLSRLGRIGALPPRAPVGRPHRNESTVARVKPADLLTALIDRDWYAAVNPDVAGLGVDPIDHFLNIGWREGRQPNPWFHTAWYLARNPQVVERDMNPLEHFVLEGAAAGLQPSPSFDIVWYSKQYLDSTRPCAEALLHFMTIGLSIGVVPYPRLQHSAGGSRTLNATNVRHNGSSSSGLGWPLSQAEEEGLVEALVDSDWYRATYSSGGRAPFNAAAHYVDLGWRQGYNPNPWFETRWYLSQNVDAQGEGIHPLHHFIQTGARTGSKPHPFFDIEWYARHYLGDGEPSAEVLRHFLTIGLRSGAVPDSRIATPAVQQHLLQIPFAERSDMIKRLQNLLLQALATGEILKSVDADLWPLLLAEDFPADVAPVLVICEGSNESRRLAAAAANILPLSECPIFGIVENIHTLRITNRLEGDGVSVRFQVHEPNVGLRDLFIQLKCRRASAVHEYLLDTPVAGMIRNAGVPLFTNVRRRGSTLPLDLPGNSIMLNKMPVRDGSSFD